VYNALSPFMHGTVVTLAKVVNVLFKGLILLWSGSMINRLVSSFMLPTVFEEMGLYSSLGKSVFGKFRDGKNMVCSLAGYVSNVMVSQPASSQNACYDDVSLGTLDLLTPMGCLLFVKTTRAVCGFRVAGPIVDAVSSPLMDANLAGVVHNFANAVLSSVVQLSEVTYLRCVRHESEAALMCIPDLEPVYVFLSTGLNSTGYLMDSDNWLNVVFVIVQNTLGLAAIEWQPAPAPRRADIAVESGPRAVEGGAVSFQTDDYSGVEGPVDQVSDGGHGWESGGLRRAGRAEDRVMAE
jgi:hypothetical protein